MNQSEEEFLKEMADWEQEPQPLSDDEMLRLHARVLERAGLKKKKARPALRVYKWAAFAAVMAFALLGAGATYFKVSDLFRPQLAAETADNVNETAYFSGEAALRSTGEGSEAGAYRIPQEVYDKNASDMGTLVDAAPVTAAGVTMKAEGLMGDADTLMLMLSAEADEGTLSGSLQLGEVWLSSASGDGTRYEQRLCDIEAVPSADGASARFFVKDKLSENILGQTVVLTVRDVTRFENSRGEALALCEPDLYAFWQKLEAGRRGQFLTDGGQLVLQGDMGALQLTEDGALQLCAMGVQDGVFYFNVTGEGKDGPPVTNLVLKNKTTGALLTGFTAVTGGQDRYLYRFEIPGIENAEELKNYTLVKNGGWCSVKVAEGVWSFEITPEYQDLSKAIILEKDIDTAQGRMHFDTLKISPIAVSFTGSASFEPDFAALFSRPCLRMADGAVVKLDSMQASYTAEDGAFTLEFILPRMIEPEKLAAVEMDGLLLELSSFLAPGADK